MFVIVMTIFVRVGIFHQMIEKVEMLLVALDGYALVDAVISGEVTRKKYRRIKTIDLIRQMVVMFAVCPTHKHSCNEKEGSATRNKAGYTATLVACGSAGAVIEKVTEAETPTNQPTNQQTNKRTKRGIVA